MFTPASRLQALVSVTPEVFAHDFWGARPLLSKAADLQGEAGACLGLADVDTLLSEHGLRTPFIRLTRDGNVLNTGRYTAGGGAGATIGDQVSDTLLTDLLLEGTTVVLQALHRNWRPVIDLVTELSAELACPVQANAYITPPDSRGFDAHYDVHDVFVIQLAGRKLWQIHAPVHEHPLADQPWTDHRAAVEARAAEQPLLEVTLEPGDVLYLPRGTVHGAVTRDDLSAHLTLGVHPVTGHAAATAALSRLKESALLRASLPLGTRLDTPLGAAAVAGALADLQAAVAALTPEDVAATLAGTVIAQTRPAPLAPLAQAAATAALSVDSALRLRAGLQTHLATHADGGAVLHLPQGRLDVAADEFAALRAMLSGSVFTPTEASIGLAEKLLRLGVVVPRMTERCAFAADERHDDLSGTAPPARRFLLVEQPGPWGRLAMEQSGLDRSVGLALAKACGAQATRPLLIRRPGRTEAPARKRWYLATTRVGHAELRTGTIGDDRELLDILDAADVGVGVGERVDTPLYAVCTHGRHDACCAIKGRPVAAALASSLGQGAWEVSHLGGDRFAGNVLVLPWGLYYGRVSVANAEAMVAATAAGEVVPELFRGRSTFVPAAQAAQSHARARSGDLRLDALTPTAVRKLDGQRFEVTLEGGWLVTVEKRAGGPPSLLTCGATATMSPPTWDLIDLIAGT